MRYLTFLMIVSCLICGCIAVNDIRYSCPSPTGTIVSGKSFPNDRLHKSVIQWRHCDHNSRQLLLHFDLTKKVQQPTKHRSCFE